MRRLLQAAFAAAALCAIGTPGSASADVLLSLGDSIGFGEQLFAGPSYGDRGFVGDYANYLGAQPGASRPTVTNLDIDGETSSSFTTGMNRVSPAGGYTNDVLQQLNLNYTNTSITQGQLLNSTLAANGQNISHVTISLGFNDIDGLASSPFYASATAAQQAVMLTNLLTSFAANEDSILTNLRSKLPSATIALIGVYNPFPGDPAIPPSKTFAPLVLAINGTIQAEAAKYKAAYVDTYSIFLGHEAAYTHITETAPFRDNVHPNDTGYALIAGQLETAVSTLAVVPELSPAMLLGVGSAAAGVLAFARRRLRRGPVA